MEEEITTIIQRKRLAAEEKLKEMKGLLNKAAQLPGATRKNIPIFPGDWSEDGVWEHIEKLKDSIRNPLRHRNKKIMEEIGVQLKGLPEEIFEESTGIEQIRESFEELKKTNTILTKTLIKKEILQAWLKEGLDKAKENLQSILEAKAGFQRILETKADEKIREELLAESLKNRDYISSAEDILSKMKFMREYSIREEYGENLEVLQVTLENVYEKITNLQDEYEVPRDEVIKVTREKPLVEVDKILEKQIEEYSKKKAKLQEEYKVYSSTLKSIGHEVPEMPEKFEELIKAVEQLNKQCMAELGKEGFSILQFLKEKAEFPEKISREGIKKTLEILRPFFLKSLREEE
jgi:chromosome segregation ATPase